MCLDNIWNVPSSSAMPNHPLLRFLPEKRLRIFARGHLALSVDPEQPLEVLDEDEPGRDGAAQGQQCKQGYDTGQGDGRGTAPFASRRVVRGHVRVHNLVDLKEK